MSVGLFRSGAPRTGIVTNCSSEFQVRIEPTKKPWKIDSQSSSTCLLFQVNSRWKIGIAYFPSWTSEIIDDKLLRFGGGNSWILSLTKPQSEISINSSISISSFDSFSSGISWTCFTSSIIRL